MSESKTPRTDAVVNRSLSENGGKFMTEDLLFKCRELETENALLKGKIGQAEIKKETKKWANRN